MANNYEVSAIFRAVDRITDPLSRMTKGVVGFSNRTERAMRRLRGATEDVKSSFSGIGRAATVGGVATGAAMTNVIGLGMGYEQMLTSAASKTDGAAKSSDILTKSYKALERITGKLGETTEYTATQAASAAGVLSQAGFSTEAIVSTLPQVVDAATALDSPLDTTASKISDLASSFNLPFKTAEERMQSFRKVAAMLVHTSNSTNANFEQLFETFKKGAPLASGIGFEMKEISAMAGIMAKSGIKAELAGTAIQNFMAAILNPIGAGAKVMDELGLQLMDDKTGEFKKLIPILGELDTKMKGYTETEKKRAAVLLLGKEGLAGNLALIAAQAVEIQRLMDKTKDLTITEAIAQIKRNTTEGSWKTLKSAIESVKLEIYALNRGAIKEAIDSMTKFVRLNKDAFVKTIQDGVEWIVKNKEQIWEWTKNITIAIGVIWTLSSVLGVLVGVMTLINLLAASNVFVIAIIAAVAAVTTLVMYWKEFVEYLRATPDYFDVILVSLGVLMAFMVGLAAIPMLIIAGIVLAIKYWDNLKQAFTDVLDYMKDKLRSFLKMIGKEDLIKKWGLDTPISQKVMLEPVFKMSELNPSNSMSPFTMKELNPVSTSFKGYSKRDSNDVPQIIDRNAIMEKIMIERNLNNTAELIVRAEKGSEVEAARSSFGNHMVLIGSGE
jgi:TP901 family phage tail tape measure protein